MPTYLCHGFRWHRRAIRIFVILQNLEDATPDWITGRKTSSIILSEFQEIYKFLPEAPDEPVTEPQDVPKINPTPTHQDDDFTLPKPRVPPEDDDVLTNSWSVVKLLEEHDPDDLLTVSRPYAYVADYVVKVDLSLNVMDEMNKYETWAKSQEGWFAKLRDELQADEKVQWFIVVCGDEPRDERDESDGEELLRDDESEVTERGVASERTSSQQEEIRPELIERKPTPFDGLDFGFGRRSDSEHMLPSPGPPPPNPPPPVPTDKPRSRAPSQSHPQPQLQPPAQIHPQAQSPVKMHTHTFSQSQSQPQLQSPQRTSSSNKPSLDANDPEVQVKSSPKLRKRKSLAAGLRRMFGKKEEQQPMPEQI